MSEQSLVYRPNELAEALGLSKTTLWRWTRDGIMPKPREIGPNSIAWVRSEIDEWLKTRPVVVRQEA